MDHPLAGDGLVCPAWSFGVDEIGNVRAAPSMFPCFPPELFPASAELTRRTNESGAEGEARLELR
jgi:hypothetical protein